MEFFLALLVLLSMIAMAHRHIVGILKGSIKFLKIHGRKKSFYFFVGAFIVFMVAVLSSPTR